jgi:hypothetical protein
MSFGGSVPNIWRAFVNSLIILTTETYAGAASIPFYPVATMMRLQFLTCDMFSVINGS